MPELSYEDLSQLELRGIARGEAEEQLRRLRQGFAAIELARAATSGDGILRLESQDEAAFLAAHAEAAEQGRLLKFVPASGAASRMFQSLLTMRDDAAAQDLPSLRAAAEAGGAAADCLRFCENWRDFAFADHLEARLQGEQPTPRELLATLLDSDRLNLAALPKGLIPFHRTDDGARTAFEEHLVEAGLYTLDGNGAARLHFTVPPEYEDAIEEHLLRGIAALGPQAERLSFGLSIQEGATDMLAGQADGTPLRDDSGRLVLRPGGHGALLSNLNALGGDLVFVKNIDNVATADRAARLRVHKATLCGALVLLQREVHALLRAWDERRPGGAELDEMEAFSAARLGLRLAGHPDDAARRERMRTALDRPLRVCGMVRNEGEPGGGPYWVRDDAGNESLQIVEASQIDRSRTDQEAAMQSATHFNPVDLVCGLHNFRGENFELDEFVDAETGFVSEKSKDGEVLRALERPGLWNGSMARWGTAFIELPIETFTPVKTVLDLLRPEHQPE